jgi:glyoxylase-like metal-dependent hydrolase (beta-lactamase superfamily II)
MNRFSGLTLAAVLLLSPLATSAQSVPDEPTVRITPIQGSLYLLQGKGGNVVASVGGDGILLIDDDYADYDKAYHKALKTISGSEGLPKFVINTHWHGDHVGGNPFWTERGAVILAQDNVYERMSGRQEMKFLDRVVEPSPKAALPVVTYRDAMSLHFNDSTILVEHYPGGHTDGDSVVFFPADNVVHMGDLLFTDRFPLVDLDNGGNVLGLTTNVAAVLNRIDDKTVVVPGHGPTLASKADLQRFHQMLLATTELVKSRLGQGMSVEEISQQGLGEQWQTWGEGFINTGIWISFIAGSLDPVMGR